ncbi:MAG: signal peptidase I [Nanoarchaeota archaeon]|nr:signal peptidase I [Nanoarchaeota archaeon]
MAVKKQSINKRILAKALSFTLLLGSVYILSTKPFISFYRVSGSSCSPFYENGDRFIATNWLQGEVGDFVLAMHCDETLIKMLAGKPGDVVKGDDYGFYCNNNLIWAGHSYHFEKKLEADEYFLLGPNYEVSMDSRIFGPVRSKDIIAKAVYTFR